MKNNVISVYGAPSSGKTTLSLKLAREFADAKKNVVVVFCDAVAPPMCTQIKFKEQNLGSLGNVLEKDELNQDIILKNCTFTEQNQYMGFLGYKTSENVKSYALYSSERAKQLIEMLSHMVDCVIIDCSSDLNNSTISSVAINIATEVLYTLSCTMKSLAFFLTNQSFVANKKTIKIINQIKFNQAIDTYISAYKGINYTLPYVDEVEEQSETFGLFDKTQNQHDQLIKIIFEKEILHAS